MAKKKERKVFGKGNLLVIIALIVLVVSVLAFSFSSKIRLEPGQQDLNGDGSLTCEEIDSDDDGVNSCDDCDDSDENNVVARADVDSDGYSTCENDCNDDSSNINPGKFEYNQAICNDGLDNDCNSNADCSDSSCGGQRAFLSGGGLTLAPTGMCCSGSAVSIDTTQNCGGCGIECPTGVQCVRQTCFDLNGLKASILASLNSNPVATGCFAGPGGNSDSDIFSDLQSWYSSITSIPVSRSYSLELDPVERSFCLRGTF